MECVVAGERRRVNLLDTPTVAVAIEDFLANFGEVVALDIAGDHIECHRCEVYDEEGGGNELALVLPVGEALG